ncbi:MAG TPA: hypothetical protein VM899_12440 [Rubellimicrobium sp.]|jgi:hypothetical protein|nr:hypothetical protein [Rubellimicrobium sp.]
MRALVLLALLPGSALAEDLAATHFQMNFCYEEAFDSAELAAAPAQSVRRIAIGRKPLGTQDHLGEVAMAVEVLLRDGSSQLKGLARCSPNADGLSCHLGRQAGGFELVAQGDDIGLTTTAPDGMLFEGWTDEVRLGAEEGVDQSFLLRRCGR